METYTTLSFFSRGAFALLLDDNSVESTGVGISDGASTVSLLTSALLGLACGAHRVAKAPVYLAEFLSSNVGRCIVTGVRFPHPLSSWLDANIEFRAAKSKPTSFVRLDDS